MDAVRPSRLPGADGKIAFTSDRAGNDEIFTMNADGSVQAPDSNTAADHEPAVSADGERIVFTSTRDGNAEIYAMNADGSGVKRLTNNAAGDQEPASPRTASGSCSGANATATPRSTR